jgi:hypothetical protein
VGIIILVEMEKARISKGGPAVVLGKRAFSGELGKILGSARRPLAYGLGLVIEEPVNGLKANWFGRVITVGKARPMKTFLSPSGQAALWVGFLSRPLPGFSYQFAGGTLHTKMSVACFKVGMSYSSSPIGPPSERGMPSFPLSAPASRRKPKRRFPLSGEETTVFSAQTVWGRDTSPFLGLPEPRGK